MPSTCGGEQPARGAVVVLLHRIQRVTPMKSSIAASGDVGRRQVRAVAGGVQRRRTWRRGGGRGRTRPRRSGRSRHRGTAARASGTETLGQVGTVVRQERGPSELLGDDRIGTTETCGQFCPQLGSVRIADDHRRHRRRPAEIVAVERRPAFRRCRPQRSHRHSRRHRCSEPTGPTITSLSKSVGLANRGQCADHRRHRVTDEDHVVSSSSA